MAAVIDARGVSLNIPPPRRVVSLVPSTTETLFALGLGERVVGVTRFCVRPRERVRALPKVGGTKDLELDRLIALAPELVLGNVEENTPAIFAAIEERFPLYAAFPRTLDDAVEDLRNLGRLFELSERAEALAAEIDAARAALRAVATPFSYVYLIWRKPYMAVGTDTFIAAVLAEAGGVNALSGPERYPEVSIEALAAADRVLLSSEPFPFKAAHADALVAAGVPREKLHFVDGQACSWHGVRLIEGLRELAAAWGSLHAGRREA